MVGEGGWGREVVLESHLTREGGGGVRWGGGERGEVREGVERR